MKTLDFNLVCRIALFLCRILVMASVVGAIVVVAATYVIDLSAMSQDDDVAWGSSLSTNATFILLLQVGAGLAIMILLRFSNLQSVFLTVACACVCLVAFGNLAAIPVTYQAPEKISRFIEVWVVRLHGLLVVSGICLLIYEWQASRKTTAGLQDSNPVA